MIRAPMLARPNTSGNEDSHPSCTGVSMWVDNGCAVNAQCAYPLYIRLIWRPVRNAAINLRALPEQRDLIDHAASVLGKNRSDFMLEAACERAQSVVLDQVFFSLDADKFKRFTAMLDAPRG